MESMEEIGASSVTQSWNPRPFLVLIDSMTTSILITGAGGMLGRTLCRHFRDSNVSAMTRADLDITCQKSVMESFTSINPDVVVHCAAMTQVDACESEEQRAFTINHTGSLYVAQAAQKIGSRLIGISTDYVFRGDGKRPYRESDPTEPQTVYGKSKLEGERAILGECDNALVARVAWLYGPAGPSFLHTMARLGGMEGDSLQVVADQVGNPTSTLAVAAHLELLLNSDIRGVVHLTCGGEATWYEFTRAIFDRMGLKREVRTCTSDAFPRPAPRPANSRLENSVLSKEGICAMPHWKQALHEFLELYPEG